MVIIYKNGGVWHCGALHHIGSVYISNLQTLCTCIRPIARTLAPRKGTPRISVATQAWVVSHCEWQWDHCISEAVVSIDPSFPILPWPSLEGWDGHASQEGCAVERLNANDVVLSIRTKYNDDHVEMMILLFDNNYSILGYFYTI
jgi:hypothetical protein